jgi:hypothetical protein
LTIPLEEINNISKKHLENNKDRNLRFIFLSLNVFQDTEVNICLDNINGFENQDKFRKAIEFNSSNRDGLNNYGLGAKAIFSKYALPGIGHWISINEGGEIFSAKWEAKNSIEDDDKLDFYLEDPEESITYMDILKWFFKQYLPEGSKLIGSLKIVWNDYKRNLNEILDKIKESNEDKYKDKGLDLQDKSIKKHNIDIDPRPYILGEHSYCLPQEYINLQVYFNNKEVPECPFNCSNCEGSLDLMEPVKLNVMYRVNEIGLLLEKDSKYIDIPKTNSTKFPNPLDPVEFNHLVDYKEAEITLTSIKEEWWKSSHPFGHDLKLPLKSRQGVEFKIDGRTIFKDFDISLGHWPGKRITINFKEASKKDLKNVCKLDPNKSNSKFDMGFKKVLERLITHFKGDLEANQAEYKGKSRKEFTQKVQNTTLQKQSNRCQNTRMLLDNKNEDGVYYEYDHIDENKNNNDDGNCQTLCLTAHQEKTRFIKNKLLNGGVKCKKDKGIVNMIKEYERKDHLTQHITNTMYHIEAIENIYNEEKQNEFCQQLITMFPKIKEKLTKVLIEDML